MIKGNKMLPLPLARHDLHHKAFKYPIVFIKLTLLPPAHHGEVEVGIEQDIVCGGGGRAGVRRSEEIHTQFSCCLIQEEIFTCCDSYGSEAKLY